MISKHARFQSTTPHHGYPGCLIPCPYLHDADAPMMIDTRPGTRSLYGVVGRRDEKPGLESHPHPETPPHTPDILRLYPRSPCPDSALGRILHGGGAVAVPANARHADLNCSCFSDDYSDDQPTIQGNVGFAMWFRCRRGLVLSRAAVPRWVKDMARSAANIAPDTAQPPNPNCAKARALAAALPERDDLFRYDAARGCIEFPMPHVLHHHLRRLGVARHFEFVPEHRPLDEERYLDLIVQGKLPIACFEEIAVGGVTDDPIRSVRAPSPLAMHMYVHDCTNHLIGWAFLPPVVRRRLAYTARLFRTAWRWMWSAVDSGSTSGYETYRLIDGSYIARPNPVLLRSALTVIRAEFLQALDAVQGSMTNQMKNGTRPTALGISSLLNFGASYTCDEYPDAPLIPCRADLWLQAWFTHVLNGLDKDLRTRVPLTLNQVRWRRRGFAGLGLEWRAVEMGCEMGRGEECGVDAFMKGWWHAEVYNPIMDLLRRYVKCAGEAGEADKTNTDTHGTKVDVLPSWSEWHGEIRHGFVVIGMEAVWTSFAQVIGTEAFDTEFMRQYELAVCAHTAPVSKWKKRKKRG